MGATGLAHATHTYFPERYGKTPYNVKKDEKKVLCLFPFEY